jgi:hypothetical protein
MPPDELYLNVVVSNPDWVKQKQKAMKMKAMKQQSRKSGNNPIKALIANLKDARGPDGHQRTLK